MTPTVDGKQIGRDIGLSGLCQSFVEEFSGLKLLSSVQRSSLEPDNNKVSNLLSNYDKKRSGGMRSAIKLSIISQGEYFAKSWKKICVFVAF